MTIQTNYYRTLYLIRRFEETVLAEFSRGVFYGTTHTCIGQEANAVGVLSQIGADDIVVSNHRCHGHFLAYGGDPRALFAEMMGKSTGVCGGRGGSQHLHWRSFYSNGILGGTLPLATGMALAEKLLGTGGLAVVFLGDGALGEGVVYESFNFASLWGAPILYVLENNHIAQTTPTRLALAGTIPARFAAFGIPTSFRGGSRGRDRSGPRRDAGSIPPSRAPPRPLLRCNELRSRPDGRISFLRQSAQPVRGLR